MYVSILEMFKIGIGPSSSHTLGPFIAAKKFLNKAVSKGINFKKVKSIKIDLYGSLALTGKGHHTDKAVILGMIGEDPATIDTTTVYDTIDEIQKEKKLNIFINNSLVDFRINFLRTQKLPFHTNGVKFTLNGKDQKELHSEIYYSIGGGFILSEEETEKKEQQNNNRFDNLPFKFKNANELFYMAESNDLSIPQIIMENEKSYLGLSEDEIRFKLDQIWEIMDKCIKRGISTEGHLPGPMRLKRRAPGLYKQCLEIEKQTIDDPSMFDPTLSLNFINSVAMGVAEENAIGGQVITSPTNGSAGVIPSVISYYLKYYSKKYPNKINDILITAGAIGGIYKMNATLSGAEGGCQAEIGVSSSMAAAGLACALDGTPYHIEHSAESAMEHFIGMTCDPIGGMVQIPCIERNAFGALKAINAASMILNDKSRGKIRLDRIVRVMKKTGDDLKVKYKETSTGGLATEYNKKFKEVKYIDEGETEFIKIVNTNNIC
jgi:L-serine dehydratase